LYPILEGLYGGFERGIGAQPGRFFITGIDGQGLQEVFFSSFDFALLQV
jgi:hypothetical protein